MELNTQTVWIEKDVKEGLPEKKNEDAWSTYPFHVILSDGKKDVAYYSFRYNHWYLWHDSRAVEVTHYLIPLTPSELKERDEKLIKWISVKTPPEKEGLYLAWVTKHEFLGPPQGVFVAYFGFGNDEDLTEMQWSYKMTQIELSHWQPLPVPPIQSIIK